MAIESIQIAMKEGARQQQACDIVGISNRTLQNWQVTGLKDQRQCVQKVPSNKLSEIEQKAILAVSVGVNILFARLGILCCFFHLIFQWLGIRWIELDDCLMFPVSGFT